MHVEGGDIFIQFMITSHDHHETALMILFIIVK